MNKLFDELSQYRKELEQLIQAKEYSNVLIKIDHFLDEISSNKSKELNYTSEHYYKDIFENSLSGFGITNFRGEIVDSNPSLLKMLGFNKLSTFKEHKIQEFYGDQNQREVLIKEIKEEG